MRIPSASLARRGLLAASLVFAAALLAACGPANAVDIKYDGYAIQSSRTSMKPGDIVFNISNKDGEVLHQFTVVQTDLPADKLPLGADRKVDETGLTIAGRVEKIDLGQSSTLTTRLAPGHYVLLCNIVGHYQLGMHVDFSVIP